MKSLYISQQGCYIALQQELLLVKQQKEILAQIQLPHLEQVLIFGKSQMTTQAIRACLWRDIPIVYLSRQGYCYGRIVAINRGFRQLARYQQELSLGERLSVARAIVAGKLSNSRTLLQRYARQPNRESLRLTVQSLDYLIDKARRADSIEQLLGYEGAGAGSYFSAFSECLQGNDFEFVARTRRPPGNPVNALLSFGYQVLWNHLLALIEIQGLDPYWACLHHSSERHAALASDLLEEFRAPFVDSLVLWLINKRIINASQDFEHRDGGCFLNNSGRKKYLKSFVGRMEETVQNRDGEPQPRWDLLLQQVKAFKQFVYQPSLGYCPYSIR
ncbi:CRISPR-associated endonuclease Cas1 [Oscillatoria sp. FACHB-1406]|uniref:CRISPR-associated endonuclease Cas1 n=1 Tax=Oscillatoria sp. FACHB-1406 TaxID=2692846 RepID=UPI001683710B|nr:CRISPR-associated endonuclease Cas1 [Oscillatoria sp. FACHB-1406]MBD2576990.1 CRISPR-associated endonuclease Cas1 [Oscillatoria sp. FACHB-1406]